MNDLSAPIPENAREFFAITRRILTMPVLEMIWGRKQAQIYRYAKDPTKFPNAEDNQRNPIECLIETYGELDANGAIEVARAVVRMQAAAVRCRLECMDHVAPDKPTLAEELLDTHPALSAMQQAMVQRKPMSTVMRLYEAVLGELEEDLEMYREETGGERSERQVTHAG
jgi:hypothetical protein